mgnify:CR=1 FL=1
MIAPGRPLLLGSASPRRREILETLGLPLLVRAALADESVLPGEAPLDYLARVGATGTALVDGADITVTVTRVQPLRVLPGADRTIVVRETATAVDEAQP